MNIIKPKKLQTTEIKKVTETLSKNKMTVFNKDIRYLKLKDIKRAYSKLIQDWCKGLILNEDAKTIAYLLTGYIQSVKQYEIEQRIDLIEKQLNDRI